MTKKIIAPICFIALMSCKSENKTAVPETKQEVPEEKASIDKLAKRYVEADLQIPATEKYSMEIYRAELNADDSMDYIVTVNRYQKAIDDAIASGKIEKYVEIGYVGKHNYFYFVDGKDLKFSPAIEVPSSPHSPLKVSFENITTEANKDIMVDYHLMNAIFRNYYTISNGTPREMLRSELIVNLGEKEEKGYVVEFAPGTNGLAKDVLVYRAELGEYTLEGQDDIYKVEPTRTKTNELVYHWLYHPGMGKYYLKQ